MGIAVFGVALLILFFLGWRESIVVMLAIPSTLALTLLVFYLYGYTLNRITLFALIFSIGILVDDAIVVVENIVRHLRLPANQGRSMTNHGDRSGHRGRQPDHPGHLGGYCRHPAHGLCRRPHGTIHAPDSHRLLGRHALLPDHRLYRYPLGRGPSPEKTPLTRSAQSVGQPSDQMPDDFFTRIYHRIMDPLLAHGSMRILFFVDHHRHAPRCLLHGLFRPGQGQDAAL